MCEGQYWVKLASFPGPREQFHFSAAVQRREPGDEAGIKQDWESEKAYLMAKMTTSLQNCRMSVRMRSLFSLNKRKVSMVMF